METVLYLFEDFELRQEDFCRSRSGQRIALEPKSLRVLLLLVSRAGHLVDKQCLLDTVWAGTFVEENTLARTVAVLRRELGDDSRKPRLIETVPTRGYRFVAPVQIRRVSISPGTSSEGIDERGLPSRQLSDGSAFSPKGGAGGGTAAAKPVKPAALASWWPANATPGKIGTAVVLVLFVSVIAGMWWHFRPRHRSVADPEASIALLPIMNETGDPHADYLADGITESVIRQLSGIPGLRVIGGASVFRYKHDQQDPRSLGRAFGVRDIMQGHLRRLEGRRLILTVEISQVDDGSVLLKS